MTFNEYVMSKVNRVLLLGVGTDGGAGQYSAQLANGLASHIETVVLLPDHDRTEFEELLAQSVTIETFPMPSTGGATPPPGNRIAGTVERLGILKSLGEEIRSIDPDLVHIPFYTSGPLRAYLLPMLKMFGLPTVGTVHDPQSHSGEESLVFGVDVKEKSRAAGGLLMDRIIVHGPETKKQAIEAGYKESKLRIVPHGIYTHFPEGDGGIDPNQLLFFGNIRENKGHDRIPELLDLVAEQHTEVTAIVAGQVPHSAEGDWAQQTLKRLRDHERVTLDHDYVSSEQAAKYFAQSAAVVLPYYDATTSGVLMVAYRYNTPVIATDVGDLGHYIKDDGTGLLATTNSTKSVAKETIRLLSDQTRRRKIVENLEATAECYSWDEIASRTVRIYSEIAG